MDNIFLKSLLIFSSGLGIGSFATKYTIDESTRKKFELNEIQKSNEDYYFFNGKKYKNPFYKPNSNTLVSSVSQIPPVRSSSHPITDRPPV